MSDTANDIELEPLVHGTEEGGALVPSSLPFLGAVTTKVEVRIGSAILSLAKLLEMQAGSVIGLDRTVDQPVDVLVGEHVVARGHLVAVGDNFGVRIAEAASLSRVTSGATE